MVRSIGGVQRLRHLPCDSTVGLEDNRPGLLVGLGLAFFPTLGGSLLGDLRALRRRELLSPRLPADQPSLRSYGRLLFGTENLSPCLPTQAAKGYSVWVLSLSHQP